MPEKESILAKDPSPEELAEFQRLFWAARAAHRKLLNNSRADIPEHVAALAYVAERKWIWAQPLLKALLLTYRNENDAASAEIAGLVVPPGFSGELSFVEGGTYFRKKEWDRAIVAFRRAAETPTCGNPGAAWSALGSAFHGKKEYDQAIEAHRRAIATPGYDCVGDSWNNIGLAHAGKKEYDSAIAMYRKALEASDYHWPGHAWNNLGYAFFVKEDYDESIKWSKKALAIADHGHWGGAWNSLGLAYYGKKQYDQAIEAYRNALATVGYATPAYPWNNLGLAYAEKKDYDAAITTYQKALAIPGNDLPHGCRLNLANAYRAAARLSEAEAEVDIVLKEPDTEGEHDRARHIRSLIEADKKKIAIKPGEEALAAPLPPSLSDGPEGRMKALVLKRENRYETYIKKRPAEGMVPDDFTVLRGWSSAVTLLEGSQDCQWRGGGYFLHWQGQGIVIDPGFDFIDNFHDAGFHGTSIRAVVVSHNHPDHNYDLGSLDDLCYELFRREKEAKPVLFAMDEDTAERFPDNSPKHRGSACKLIRYNYEHKLWQGGPKEDLPFTLQHFPVEHGDDVRRALGLRFRLHPKNPDGKDLVVGYTGDGRFTPELVEHLRGVDILIAHVSQPDEREFNDPDFLKDVHLGYNGVTKLVKEIKPKLTLVGEFWAGLADLRLDLIAGIRLRSGVPTVLPACLGLRLRLPEMTVRCTRCQKQTPAERIKVAPPIREFGELGYLCPECIL